MVYIRLGGRGESRGGDLGSEEEHVHVGRILIVVVALPPRDGIIAEIFVNIPPVY